MPVYVLDQYKSPEISDQERLAAEKRRWAVTPRFYEGDEVLVRDSGKLLVATLDSYDTTVGKASVIPDDAAVQSQVVERSTLYAVNCPIRSPASWVSIAQMLGIPERSIRNLQPDDTGTYMDADTAFAIFDASIQKPHDTDTYNEIKEVFKENLRKLRADF